MKQPVGLFQKIHVENFRLFSAMTFSFLNPNNEAKKVVLIYGENGSGKSSFIDTFSFLWHSLNTIIIDTRFRSFFDSLKKNSDISPSLLKAFSSGTIRCSQDLISSYKRIGSEKKPMKIDFSFSLDGKNGIYSLEYGDQFLEHESLSFQVSERIVPVFEIFRNNHANDYFNERVFIGKDALKKLISEVAQKFGLHSFFALFASFLDDSVAGYINSSFDQSLLDVFRFFNSLVLRKNDEDLGKRYFESSLGLLTDPSETDISSKNQRLIAKTEKALRLFLPSLYSRIKGVHYQKSEEDKKSCLVFEEIGADGTIINVPFNEESTGTKRIVSLFFFLYAAVCGMTVIIDEIDTGIHDILMSKLFASVCGEVKGQLIVTTHNTLLMRDVSPKNIYLFNFESGGSESFYSIDGVSSSRIQEKTDIMGRYLRGLYGGVPNSSSVSIDQIRNQLGSLSETTSSQADPKRKKTN